MFSGRRALVLTSLENLGLTLIRTLAGKGMKVTIAGGGPGRLLRLSRHCSSYHRIAAGGDELAEARPAAVESAARLARERGIDVVVPVDVPGGLFASALRPMLPGVVFYPFSDPSTLRLLDNKWTFHGFLARHGLPTPRTWLLESAEQASGLPLPLVLKPLAEAGGSGVAVVRDAAARDARLSGAARRHRFPTLAQEFIEGEDVSLSFLADRGRLLAWSVHMHGEAGGKEYIVDGRVVDLGRRIAAASGYHGVANFDMRYDEGRRRVFVIECNPRFWGTFKFTLGLGIDYLERGLALAEGRPSAPFAGAPAASVPGLAGSVKRRLKGLAIPAESRPYLAQKIGDPLPEAYYAALHILRLKGNQP